MYGIFGVREGKIWYYVKSYLYRFHWPHTRQLLVDSDSLLNELKAPFLPAGGAKDAWPAYLTT